MRYSKTAIVGKSDEGEIIVLDRDGFAASFRDGVWVPNIIFSAYELWEYFRRVTGEEAEILIDAARRELYGSDL